MKRKYTVKRYDGTPSRRKFLGFDFYIQCNEKLSQKNRKTLIKKSESYLGSIYNSINLPTEEKIKKGIIDSLDSKSSDLELIDEWNFMYEQYGYLIPELKEKWEKKYLKGNQTSNKISKTEMFETKINELEIRIRQMELQLNRRRSIENMG